MDTGRIVRIIIGVALIATGIIFKNSIWIIGLLPLFAGIINRCPTFLSPGSACSIETKKKEE
ncbi:MAG: DUF2892 domain-containing protein [bacterium]